MKVEVINTGTELLLGEILNTNFQYLSRQLLALPAAILPKKFYAKRLI